MTLSSVSRSSLLLLGLIALLSGCATPGVQNSARLEWQMKGKLSLRTASESRILGIEWRQWAVGSDIRLMGPLGVTVAEIQADAGGFTVKTSEGIARFTEEDALALPEVGEIRLPWRSLSSWVRGLSADGRVIGSLGLVRGDWRVRVLKKGDDGPRLVHIEHPGLSLRLQAREWLVFNDNPG
ncbi:MAG: lipoprotein insertase outer membrane protein LolB [Proteobacteria bacterium]|nr:lipoprotein insertase outer membrane protein LolB [Pseudomonadota bacterium]